VKILVVGAGVGGLAFAALARRPGVEIELIDRAGEGDPSGYAISLYPNGSRVLHGLGVYDAFVERSAEFRFYDVHDGRGVLLHRFDMRPIEDRHGKIGQIARGNLIELLRASAPDIPLRRNLSVSEIRASGDRVWTRFSDDSEGEWDAVIVADGMRSFTRDLLFEYQPRHETGWGLWVWWSDRSNVPADTVSEYWGLGRFAGTYPTPERVGAVLAGPRALLNPHVIDGKGERVREHFTGLGGAAAELVATFPDQTAGLFYRDLSDVRSREWFRGRVALLGDSACSFLPTAGIGASMALESAAVLADELSRTNAQFLPQAFSLYEKRRKKRSETGQDDARALAAWLSTSSAALAWTRDQFLRFSSENSLAATVARSLEEPI
jgi:FAD-dependent urate hydroxylase